MQIQTTQLRVTLSTQLQTYLQAKANKFGLNMSSYVKNLIINDVKDDENPIYQASQKTELAYQAAKQADVNGELITVRNLKDYLNNL